MVESFSAEINTTTETPETRHGNVWREAIAAKVYQGTAAGYNLANMEFATQCHKDVSKCPNIGKSCTKMMKPFTWSRIGNLIF